MPPMRRPQKPPSMLIVCRVALMFFFFVIVGVIVWNPFYPGNRPVVNSITSYYHSHNVSWMSPIDTSNLLHAVESMVASLTNEDEADEKLHNNDQDSTHIIKKIKELRDRAATFLNWVAIHGNENFIRWDMISKADLHILYKLIQSLDFYLVTPEGQAYLTSIYKYGMQCSPLQAAQQEIISKFIAMDICSEVEWYKLVQLSWPEAQTFVDVGANKGYLGALFLTLWGGNGLQSSPADVYTVTKRLNSWKNSRNPSGYCKDGENRAIQSYCPPQYTRNVATGKCTMANPNIRVYSFDGSSYLTKTLNDIINKKLHKETLWKYSNFAISDEEGIARFTKQDSNYHAGFEGGGIRGSSSGRTTTTTASSSSATTRRALLASEPAAAAAAAAAADLKNPRIRSTTALDQQKAAALLASTEEVPMTTIDIFLRKHNITSVDIMKIDTEGNDNKVLRGAKHTIAKLVGMFTFEGGKGVSLTKDMLHSLDKLNFNCYSTSRAGLFKWNGNCMKSQYTGGFRAKDKGNIFCISRKRAALAAFAYEMLSFPAMIQLLFDKQRRTASSTAATVSVDQAKIVAMLEALNKTKPNPASSAAATGAAEDSSNIVTLQSKIDPSLLIPLYVNIYGYCAPWPSCVKVENLTIPTISQRQRLRH